MKNRLIKIRERGDTIVEVLIALAILTAVLGGAYYSANQSFRSERDSQEHTEALTIAQTQLEELRVYGNTFDSSNPNNACMGGTVPVMATSCQFSNNGTPCVASNTCYYTASIQGPNLPTNPPVSLTVPVPTGNANVILDTYKISVVWNALGGGGQDNVTLYYRVDS